MIYAAVICFAIIVLAGWDFGRRLLLDKAAARLHEGELGSKLLAEVSKLGTNQAEFLKQASLYVRFAEDKRRDAERDATAERASRANQRR